MSKIQVDAIEPQCGNTLTVGAAGKTVAVPGNVVKSNALQASDAGNIISQSGTTITLGATGDNIVLAGGATQSGFGRTGTVDWNTTPKTATFTAVSGDGFFANTSGGAFTMNLPAGTAGAIVSVADYAATWQTNNVTVVPNGTDKIGSLNSNATLDVQGQSVTFVFVDATQGWINTMDSTSNVRGLIPFICASVSGSGNTLAIVDTNFKIATFTGPGTFTVNSISTVAANNVLDYVVVAGGGSGPSTLGGEGISGGGGGGGFRYFANTTNNPQTGSGQPGNNYPGSNTVSATIQGYSIAIGGGGPSAQPVGSPGVNTTALGITSTGGGRGGRGDPSPAGQPGGNGGGGNNSNQAFGDGNTPPVSPSQGNRGGNGGGSSGGGGGGSRGIGGAGSSSGGNGGNGAGITGFGTTGQLSSGQYYFSGGGGGANGNANFPSPGAGGSGGLGGGANGLTPSSSSPTTSNGTANTGGGGGGASDKSPTGSGGGAGGAGGSGIVIIRYKFQ